MSKCLGHQCSPYLNASPRSPGRHREATIAFGCSDPVLDAGTWAEWGLWEQAGKRRTEIVEMPLFTSVMQLYLNSSTFCEQVLKSASISFCNELFIPCGWGWLGLGFHRQVYYTHLAPTPLACSKPQLFSQHLFLAFIVLDVKTFGLCNSALVLGVRVWGDGELVSFFWFFLQQA